MQSWLSNPEFQRQLWLELTRHRLIVAPVILLIVFGTRFDDGGLLASLNLMAGIALAIFVIITILWGASFAYTSLSDEIRQNTWDWQRVSAMQPWDMVWGKIIGSTAFAWYIGLPCLAIIALSPEHNVLWLKQSSSGFTLLLLIFSALAAQGFGLLSALVAHQCGMLQKKASGFIFVFILIAWKLIAIKPSVGDAVGWFGFSFSGQTFLLLSVMLFTGWIWLGCYRLMQGTLMIKTKPWAAVAFIVFLSVYSSGKRMPWDFEPAHLNTIALYGMVIGMVMTYLGAWLERINRITVKRLYLALGQNDRNKALEETPFFAATCLITLCCLIWTLLFFSLDDSDKPLFDFLGKTNLKAEIVVLFLLMLRDIGILAYCSLNAKSQRGGATAVFYILLLDFIFPVFLPRPLVGFVMPAYTLDMDGWFGIVVSIFHLVLIFWLLNNRFKLNFTKP